jgi:hypothetical protein
MRKIATALAIATVLMAGCATQAALERRLNTYLGASEVEVIRDFGPPQNVYETGGSKFIHFSRSGTMVMPGVAPSFMTTRIGNTFMTQPVGGSPGFAVQVGCEIRFELQQERVVRWSFRGNDCKERG